MGDAEKTMWNSFDTLRKEGDYNTLQPDDQSTFYTGDAAFKALNNVIRLFEKLQIKIRVIRNTFNKPGFTNARSKFKATAGGKPWGEGAVASNQFALVAKEKAGRLNLIFSKEADAQAAIASNGRVIPPGYLWSYELNTITARDSKVTEIAVWDIETLETNLNTPGYEPPILWRNGQDPLGPPVDFSVNPKPTQ
jgi:hypothetical protein